MFISQEINNTTANPMNMQIIMNLACKYSQAMFSVGWMKQVSYPIPLFEFVPVFEFFFKLI
jgi:hypothetical protein